MTVGDWIEMLLYSDQAAITQPVALLFTLLFAFAIGQMIGWIYLLTDTGLDHQRSFIGALVVLPVIVALLMMLMAGSLMVAFGLLAVLAVVRFRNVLRDTRDTTFVLWSIVEGMAVGTLRYSTALMGAAAIAVIVAYLRVSNFGTGRLPDGALSVEIANNSATGREALTALLYRHANRWTLKADRNMPGQGRVVTYDVHLRDRGRVTDLRDELATMEELHEVSYIPQQQSPKEPKF